MQLPTPAGLTRTIYAFGAPGEAWYGRLALDPGGIVKGYNHPNERGWRLNDGHLEFLSEDGKPTSAFPLSEGVMAGRSQPTGGPLVLLPIIEGPPGLPTDRPAVLVNSIPKAGTYFLEAAFAGAGWVTSRLHFGPDTVDDYRGMPAEEMHQDPESVRSRVPTQLFGTLLAAGTVSVAHLPDVGSLSAHGVLVAPVVRDLRDVVISLARFKRWKVRAKSPGARATQTMPADEALLAFMAFAADGELRFLHDVARGIAEGPDPYLRYESCRRGELPKWFCQRLESIGGVALVDRFEGSMRTALDAQTSTLTPHREPLAWSPGVEHLFRELGLAEVNAEFGYPP